MRLIPITDLKIGDEFEYINGTSGYPCKVVGLNSTPTGKFSVQYKFHDGKCKQNLIKLFVYVK